MPRRFIPATLIAVVLAVWTFACGGGEKTSGRTPSKAANPACQANAKPANLTFTLKDIHGRPTSLAAYKGKVVLIDFWATWCGPCQMEIPGFVELYDKYRAHGFEIVGLLTQDQATNAPSFMEKFRMNYPVLDASDREDIEDAYGPLWGLPTSFLISKDGLICRTHVGFSPKSDFEREITALLAL